MNILFSFILYNVDNESDDNIGMLVETYCLCYF